MLRRLFQGGSETTVGQDSLGGNLKRVESNYGVAGVGLFGDSIEEGGKVLGGNGTGLEAVLKGGAQTVGGVGLFEWKF